MLNVFSVLSEVVSFDKNFSSKAKFSVLIIDIITGGKHWYTDKQSDILIKNQDFVRAKICIIKLNLSAQDHGIKCYLAGV